MKPLNIVRDSGVESHSPLYFKRTNLKDRLMR